MANESYLNPEQSAAKRAKRAEQAAEDFETARDLAREYGWELKQHSDIHYSLSWGKGRLLNIYPSNRRLYSDPRHRGPFLLLPDDWDLLDVIATCIVKVAERSKVCRREYVVDKGNLKDSIIGHKGDTFLSAGYDEHTADGVFHHDDPERL